MKKIISIALLLVILVSLVGCTFFKKDAEEKFLGNWLSYYETSTRIFYSFNHEDGKYKAGCVIDSGDGDPDAYVFDKYTVTDSTITFHMNGKTVDFDYYFEDEYLFINNIKFYKTK